LQISTTQRPRCANSGSDRGKTDRAAIRSGPRQIERGAEPDDYIDPKELEPPRRRRLRDALKAVRGVQRRLGRWLSGELAFA